MKGNKSGCISLASYLTLTCHMSLVLSFCKNKYAAYFGGRCEIYQCVAVVSREGLRCHRHHHHPALGHLDLPAVVAEEVAGCD